MLVQITRSFESLLSISIAISLLISLQFANWRWSIHHILSSTDLTDKSHYFSSQVINFCVNGESWFGTCTVYSNPTCHLNNEWYYNLTGHLNNGAYSKTNEAHRLYLIALLLLSCEFLGQRKSVWAKVAVYRHSIGLWRMVLAAKPKSISRMEPL